MKRDIHLFYDCCRFWERMGVKKEDNIIAFALADMNIVCKKHFEILEWNNYYREIYNKAYEEAMKPIYNENRGQMGFLSNSGL